eukprot:5309766-Amphidinium_carterae.1
MWKELELDSVHKLNADGRQVVLGWHLLMCFDVDAACSRITARNVSSLSVHVSAFTWSQVELECVCNLRQSAFLLGERRITKHVGATR